VAERIDTLADSHLAWRAAAPPSIADNIRRQPAYVVLCIVVALIGCGLFAYSQTKAFAQDEGYHLLAAQLILDGKRPYLDFLYPQTPLSAYWNAGWMSLLGQGWRQVHGVGAVTASAPVMLIADFVFVRAPNAAWRLPGATLAAVAFGLNAGVFEFTTVGQPYALCLLLMAAALRLSVASPGGVRPLMTAGAGFCASAAACASLLTAPAALVLLVWTLVVGRPGSHLLKAAAFVAGACLPVVPLLWLFVQGPRQVVFNVIEYQLLYRLVDWPGAYGHDLGVYLSWANSGQALLLVALAAVALVAARRGNGWARARRAEVCLCGWLGAALALHISTAHPTFAWYYLLLVPFLAVLAPIGLFEFAARVGGALRPWLAVGAVMAVMIASLAHTLHADWDDLGWKDFERLAAKVNEVTPKGGQILADEHIYFLTGRAPPEGAANMDSHKLSLPPQLAALLHVTSHADFDRQVAAGLYDTVALCEPDLIEKLDLDDLYAQKYELPTTDCAVFWQPLSLRSRETTEAQ
jgi:hypothetical protein